MADPDLYARIQLLELSVGLMLPPLQLKQLSHRMLATSVPSEVMPLPSNTEMVASELKSGSVWPVPSLGETVTLVLEAAYTTIMLAPDMREPWPKPTHSVPLGALIWRKIDPLPDEAVSDGTLTEMA